MHVSQCMLAYLLTLVLAIFQSSNDLSVDEVCTDTILAAVMPGGENLFAEVETPGSVLLLPTLPSHLLLTLRYGIHHMLMSTAKRPYLMGTQDYTLLEQPGQDNISFNT